MATMPETVPPVEKSSAKDHPQLKKVFAIKVNNYRLFMAPHLLRVRSAYIDMWIAHLSIHSRARTLTHARAHSHTHARTHTRTHARTDARARARAHTHTHTHPHTHTEQKKYDIY